MHPGLHTSRQPLKKFVNKEANRNMSTMEWVDFIAENKNFFFGGKKVYVVYDGRVDSVAPGQYLYYLWHHINHYGEGIAQLGGVMTLKNVPKHLRENKDSSKKYYSTDPSYHVIEPLDWTLDDWKSELEYWKKNRIWK